MKLISVIIPHYNTPELLSKLLDSIPNNNDIEVIVVDDNSNCNLDIYEQCVEKNKGRNVHFYSNPVEKKGAGNARNLGIEKAQGKWLIFADADDYFTDIAFDIFEKYLNTDLDVIYFSATSIYMDTLLEADRHKHYAELTAAYIKDKSKETELAIRYKWWSPCCKLIRKSLIEQYDLKYDGTLYSNDVMFSTMLGYYAKNIDVSDSVVYCITKSSESLTAKKDEKAFSIRQKVALRRLGFLISHLSYNEMVQLGFSWKDYIYYYFYKHR